MKTFSILAIALSCSGVLAAPAAEPAAAANAVAEPAPVADAAADAEPGYKSPEHYEHYGYALTRHARLRDLS
jgi:hypothetical protein